MTPRIPRKFIAEKTAEAFGFTFEELISARRSEKITPVRRAAWMLIKEFRPDSSTSQIGLLCNRDHSTVVLGLQKGRMLLLEDDAFRAQVDALREMFRRWPDAAPARDAQWRPEIDRPFRRPNELPAVHGGSEAVK